MTLDEAELQLQDVVKRFLDGRPRVRVLEAGCGSASHLTIPVPRYMVGIDVSARQLERNELLDEKIQADLQACELPANAFDVVICWDVLEHLPAPDRALERLARAVAPGGIMILAMPNLLSVKGLVTKFTPHWFHVAFYRHVWGVRDAGKDDRAPFQTYLRRSITPQAIQAFAARHGLQVAHFATCDIASTLRQLSYPVWILYGLVRALAWSLSLGKLGASDFVLVLRK